LFTGSYFAYQVNQAAFSAAVDEITAVTAKLLAALETNAQPKSREVEAAKVRLRNGRRFSGA
jgi:hypothetical protein